MLTVERILIADGGVRMHIRDELFNLRVVLPLLNIDVTRLYLGQGVLPNQIHLY